MKIAIACSGSWFLLDKELTIKNNILFIHEKEHLTEENLAKFSPDIIFFPHWNWTVSEKIFDNYECIVFHTAPLPYGRGGSPIQNLILAKFEEAPVCALKMTSELDAGPIYLRKTISLSGSLDEILKRINFAINDLIKKLIVELPLPDKQIGSIHKFQRLRPEDNLIPSDINIKGIYDRIRMLDHSSYPNSYMLIGDLRLEFSKASISGKTVIANCRITKC